jgi:glycosyltransferase involved in cell wall biosynthesis
VSNDEPVAARWHVCFAFHGVQTVGAERSLLALAEAARAAGDSVTLVVPRHGVLDELIAEKLPGVAVHYCPTQWWMGDRHVGVRGVLLTVQSLLHTWGWRKALRTLRPDTVIVGSTVAPAPLVAARLTRTPVALLLSESIRTNPTLRSVVPKPLVIRLLHRLATVTVAVSRYSAEQYGGATLVAPPAIDPPSPELAAALGGRRHTESPLQAVMLGTLSSEKGQLEAVAAMRQLKERGVDVRLDFYGDASEHDLAVLQAAISRHGLSTMVRHRGSTDSPLEVLAEADVSLVCSGNEAYGRVTAESVLVATPVVGYDAGATGEVLEAGGGFLVSPSPDALADALAELARDPLSYERLSDDALRRSRMSETFGTAAQTLRTIYAALGRRAR